MSVTSLLDVRFAADRLEDGPRALLEILADTRAFDGCLGVQVVTDVTDPAHVIAVEHWESLEHDDAYRAWRARPRHFGPRRLPGWATGADTVHRRRLALTRDPQGVAPDW